MAAVWHKLTRFIIDTMYHLSTYFLTQQTKQVCFYCFKLLIYSWYIIVNKQTNTNVFLFCW